MVKGFSFLVVLSLIAATAIGSEVLSGESEGDFIIRQVVDDGGVNGGSNGDDLLLGAEHHFSIFKRRFGKSYASNEEHDHRFRIFKANLRRARRHQALDPSATHGVTQFSDLTPSEFRRSFLGLRDRLRLPADANKAPILPTDDLPTDFDWRDHGAVTEVKNQVCVFLLPYFSIFGYFVYVSYFLVGTQLRF